MPAQILNLFLNGKITVLYDTRIMKEYLEVLSRKKFRFKRNWIDPLLDYIRNEGEYITAEPVQHVFLDENDKMFYEVARTGNAEYIITGNKGHFPDEEMVITPREFIEIFILKNETKK
jgi:putative PIN family toxin of toxin-antitoxin system